MKADFNAWLAVIFVAARNFFSPLLTLLFARFCCCFFLFLCSLTSFKCCRSMPFAVVHRGNQKLSKQMNTWNDFCFVFSINLRRERFIIDCAVCPLPTMQTTFRILNKKNTNSKYLLLVGCCCCCYFLVYDFPCWSLSWSFSWWSNDWNCE